MEYVFACVAFLLINIFYEGLVSFIGFLLFNCLTLGLVRVDPINEKNVFFLGMVLQGIQTVNC